MTDSDQEKSPSKKINKSKSPSKSKDDGQQKNPAGIQLYSVPGGENDVGEVPIQASDPKPSSTQNSESNQQPQGTQVNKGTPKKDLTLGSKFISQTTQVLNPKNPDDLKNHPFKDA